ncbi:MAG: MBL fold metallo-hydrolase [Anaerolineaceae bacterium]
MPLPTDRDKAVSAIKQRVLRNYPSLWKRLIIQWQQNSTAYQPPDNQHESRLDRGWLIYAANYLFCTNNVRWAIDPFTIYTRLNQLPPFDLAADLQSLDFVLLTHQHADHLDRPLIKALAKYPIRWVIPEFLLPLLEDCQLNPHSIIVPQVMEPIQFQHLTITPFEGLHHHTTPDGVLRGVLAMGYHVSSGSKTWLFPGDTRSHHPEKIPSFPPADIVFAHLWLGKACADMPIPPKVEDFCRFFLALQPKRLLITHLHEIGRVPNEFWDARHYNLVKTRIKQLNPTLPVSRVQIGQFFAL